ncbi:MAG: helix-turn-helix domain-containing protein [Gaiellaceae bacterium]
MKLELPPEALDELVAEVTRRVLVELRAEPKVENGTSPYATVAEAAEYLRCSRQRIDDLLSQRRLTRHKEGRRTLLSRAELERHVNGE